MPDTTRLRSMERTTYPVMDLSKLSTSCLHLHGTIPTEMKSVENVLGKCSIVSPLSIKESMWSLCLLYLRLLLVFSQAVDHFREQRCRMDLFFLNLGATTSQQAHSIHQEWP